MAETLELATAPRPVAIPPETVEFLTRREVAALLRVSGATVDRLVRKDDGFPPPAKFGAIMRFRRSAVLAYLSAHESREPVEVRARRFRQPKKGSKSSKSARK